MSEDNGSMIAQLPSDWHGWLRRQLTLRQQERRGMFAELHGATRVLPECYRRPAASVFTHPGGASVRCNGSVRNPRYAASPWRIFHYITTYMDIWPEVLKDRLAPAAIVSRFNAARPGSEVREAVRSPKYLRRLPDFDEKMLLFYGRGLSTRDISEGTSAPGPLRELDQTEVSPDLISEG